MKSTSILKYGFLLLLLGISIASCIKKEPKENKHDDQVVEIIKRTSSVEYTLIDSIHNFDLTITFYDDKTNSLSDTENAIIGDYLLEMFPSYGLTDLSRIDAFYYFDSIEMQTTITLTGVEVRQESDIPVAVAFNGNGNNGNGGTINCRVTGNSVDKHSCSGAPCECCDYLYEKVDHEWSLLGCIGCVDKRIVGCQCRTVPAKCATINGFCNHTKSTG